MDVADRIERLEVLIKKLAGDVGELRNEMRTEFRTTNKRVEAVEDGQDGIGKDIQELRRIMAASVDAMTSVIRQVTVDKAVETRLRRLESAVFGAKD
jgi:hypothetical protein